MHVAFIPDGNRRWAKKNNVSLQEAYLKGTEKLKDVLQWSKDLGVKEVTVWAMSYDNYKKRSPEEISLLFQIMKNYRQWLGEIKNVKVEFVGKLDELPQDILEMIEEVKEKGKEGEYKINVLFLYNGRWEILEVAKKGPKTEEELYQALLLKSFPDIVIRTGGQVRTSGFLPIQTEYSEWFFLEKLWPDFSFEDYKKILEDFQKRQRNFGK
ncbi:MAG: di-trans,poly-cis-decaprenylcistransferase [Candidatus Micrarchaeota archaeon]|nr:di-trans,poly-cis-decaprenylcistransferase [Candidatus Micrarchaeota archaeon]